MKLYITAETNMPICEVNTITVTTPEGDEIVLDRDETEYDVHDGILNMSWRGVYIWDGEKEQYIKDASELAFLETAKKIEVDIEDDADPEYFVKNIDISI